MLKSKKPNEGEAILNVKTKNTLLGIFADKLEHKRGSAPVMSLNNLAERLAAGIIEYANSLPTSPFKRDVSKELWQRQLVLGQISLFTQLTILASILWVGITLIFEIKEPYSISFILSVTLICVGVTSIAYIRQLGELKLKNTKALTISLGLICLLPLAISLTIAKNITTVTGLNSLFIATPILSIVLILSVFLPLKWQYENIVRFPKKRERKIVAAIVLAIYQANTHEVAKHDAATNGEADTTTLITKLILKQVQNKVLPIPVLERYFPGFYA